MSFWQSVYQLLITPLGLLFETIFSFAYGVMGNVGLSIIPLSLIMNFMLLPFYNRAAVIQQEEHELEQRLAPGIAHIKKTFKGDKRFMILQTYYRQNHYSPLFTVKSSFSLLLQIPFFMAAYNFLSNYGGMKGTSFWFLKDMGQPDQLFTIGGFGINVLPILMTLINIVSSTIYTKKGSSIREKIQLYGMALLFLVILYRSPSGLVFYWTLNNTFSLIKNIVYKAKNKKFVMSILFGLMSAITFFYAVIFKGDNLNRMVIMIAGIIFLVPILAFRVNKKEKPVKVEKEEGDSKVYNKIFIFSALFMAAMTGLLIPSAVIHSSPSEFVFLGDFHSPARYIVASFLIALGVFVVWCGLFYYLSARKARKVFSIAMCILSVEAAVNYLFFGKKVPFLRKTLVFEDDLTFSTTEKFINILVVIAVASLIAFVWKKKPEIVSFAVMVLFLGTAGLGAYNMLTISKMLPSVKEDIGKPSYTLSKNGENVVVIMLDRAMSCYVPYMFEEDPDLKEQFEGFTWYPNTLSFGATTNIGTPGLFGGYEYQPLKINARSTESLKAKQNEALRTMPVIFDEAGYDVTVCNPPYANYENLPDVSIFDDHPDIKAYATENGQYSDTPETRESYVYLWNRDFFCYGFARSLPLVLQNLFYDDGSYHDPDWTSHVINIEQFVIDQGKYVGMPTSFIDCYEFLKDMPNITVAEDKDANTFIMMNNSTPHNVAVLQEPEYEPSMVVNNTEYDATHADRFTVDGRTIAMESDYELSHYQCNMAAMKLLGKWFDHLREEGVYDNTRIILVSDHGFMIDHFDDLIFGNTYRDDFFFNIENVLAYNAFLMVKDFDSADEFKRDDTFMMNADTPTLAFDQLIEDPVHPDTGVPITDADKYEDTVHVMYTIDWSINSNNGDQFSEGVWFGVKNQDIFNTDNWIDEGRGIH